MKESILPINRYLVIPKLALVDCAFCKESYLMLIGLVITEKRGPRYDFVTLFVGNKALVYYSPRSFFMSSTFACAFVSRLVYWHAQDMVSLISQ